jgi:hypothetical protein
MIEGKVFMVYNKAHQEYVSNPNSWGDKLCYKTKKGAEYMLKKYPSWETRFEIHEFYLTPETAKEIHNV